MIITFEERTATNEYLTPPVSHIQLSHPDLNDSLLLAECDEKPYERNIEGWTQSNGRSLSGLLRLKGNNYRTNFWQCNFLVTALQVDLFNQLLVTQEYSPVRVQFTDRWVNGMDYTTGAWLDVDRQYLSVVAANSWWRLQFTALEV